VSGRMRSNWRGDKNGGKNKMISVALFLILSGTIVSRGEHSRNNVSAKTGF